MNNECCIECQGWDKCFTTFPSFLILVFWHLANYREEKKSYSFLMLFHNTCGLWWTDDGPPCTRIPQYQMTTGIGSSFQITSLDLPQHLFVVLFSCFKQTQNPRNCLHQQFYCLRLWELFVILVYRSGWEFTGSTDKMAKQEAYIKCSFHGQYKKT